MKYPGTNFASFAGAKRFAQNRMCLFGTRASQELPPSYIDFHGLLYGMAKFVRGYCFVTAIHSPRKRGGILADETIKSPGLSAGEFENLLALRAPQIFLQTAIAVWTIEI
jgi:hypothetical protein